MQKKNKKKKWEKPKLVILTRGKPEETVLTSCKMNSGGGIFPSMIANGCFTGPSLFSCGFCRDPSES